MKKNNKKERKNNIMDNILNKRNIIALLVLIPLLVAVIILINTTSYGVNETNNNMGINKEQIVEKLKVSDGIVIQDKGIFTYSANVTNTDEETKEINYLTLSFYDKENNKIVTLYGYIGKKLEPNETVPVLASVDKDISSASSIKIELNK